MDGCAVELGRIQCAPCPIGLPGMPQQVIGLHDVAVGMHLGRGIKLAGAHAPLAALFLVFIWMWYDACDPVEQALFL